MVAGSCPRFVLSTLVAAAAVAGAGHAASVPFRTHFGADTVGLPPGIGGLGQPTGMDAPAGSSITVVGGALGLETQPVELASPNGTATWLSWNLVPAVSDLGVEIRFAVSFESAFTGVFFDTNGPGGVQVRLETTAAGELRLADGCTLSSLGGYTPGMPVAVVLLFAPPSSFWVVADGEGDGFDDNTPVAGESCRPGNLHGFYAYAWRSAPGAASVAFDDFEVDWMPLFVDDFETGGMALWSVAAP